jgi:uncharacterized protein YkwD
VFPLIACACAIGFILYYFLLVSGSKTDVLHKQSKIFTQTIGKFLVQSGIDKYLHIPYFSMRPDISTAPNPLMLKNPNFPEYYQHLNDNPLQQNALPTIGLTPIYQNNYQPQNPTPLPYTNNLSPDQQTADAINYLNQMRAMDGLPPVYEDKKLSKYALLHANYLLVNKVYASTQRYVEYNGNPLHIEHTENPTKPAYTSEGYDSATHSNVMWNSYEVPSKFNIQSLLVSPPHRFNMLNPQLRFVGFGKNDQYSVLDVLHGIDYTVAWTDWPVIYPANGETDVSDLGSAEDLTFNSCYDGSTNQPSGIIPRPDVFTISLQYAPFTGKEIKVTKITLTDTINTQVPFTWCYPDNDWFVYVGIYPHNDLQKASTYHVSAEGTYKNVPFKKSWSFTTVH